MPLTGFLPTRNQGLVTRPWTTPLGQSWSSMRYLVSSKIEYKVRDLVDTDGEVDTKAQAASIQPRASHPDGTAAHR